MLITFILGLLAGIIFSMLLLHSKSVGNLRIDDSDPDGPYMFLELSKHPNEIRRKKYVTFRVKAENFISHK